MREPMPESFAQEGIKPHRSISRCFSSSSASTVATSWVGATLYRTGTSGRGPVIPNSSERMSTGVLNVYRPHIATYPLLIALRPCIGSELTGTDPVDVPQDYQGIDSLPTPIFTTTI